MIRQALDGISDDKLLDIIKNVNGEFADILTKFDNKPAALRFDGYTIEATTFYDDETQSDEEKIYEGEIVEAPDKAA